MCVQCSGRAPPSRWGGKSNATTFLVKCIVNVVFVVWVNYIALFFWDIWGSVVALRDASSISQVYPDSCFKSVAVDNSYSVPQLSILCPVNQLDLNQLLHIISGRQLTWSNCIHCVQSVTACSLLPLGSLTQRDGNGQKQVHRLPSRKLT